MFDFAFGLRSASFVTAGAVLAAAASAQALDYTFDASSSSVMLNTDVDLDLTGNLKGVYDATTNPGGTRTVLRLFGDNGLNNEAPVSITLGVAAAIGGALDGTFEMSYDEALGAVVIENLAATVGASGSSSADLTVTLTYDTFRSINPGSVFIGGFPLSIPLGTATVSDVVLTQSGVGGGAAMVTSTTLVSVTGAVPAELSFNVDLSALGGGAGGGGVTPVGPLPVLIPMDGVFDLADCGTALTASGTDTAMQTLPNPFPLDLVDVPLPLPTILPLSLIHI